MKPDVQLQRDVLEELDFESALNAAQLAATVHGGVVTLTGHVPAYSDKLTAEEAAKRVHGVKAVVNEIDVRPPESHQRDDAHLAAAAVHALEWNSNVPSERIRVVVRHGTVILEGTVDRRQQRSSAERAVRHLKGAKHVANQIRVATAEVPKLLKEVIEAALRRSATLNSKRIAVETHEQTVTLTGDVHSHAELEEAERLAWSARGVREVVNCLSITPWGYGPAEEWGY